MARLSKVGIFLVLIVSFLVPTFSFPEKALADNYAGDVPCALGVCKSPSCAPGDINTRAACSLSGVTGVCCTVTTNSAPNTPSALCQAPNTCQPGCQQGRVLVAGDCGSSGLKCCGTASSSGSSQSIEFPNPLRFDTIDGVLTSLLGTLQAIIVILAIIFIIIGAILYITSAGNDTRMSTAKGAITAAMIGLAIALAAPSFLKEIGLVLGWGNVNNATVVGAKTLTEIATNVLNFLLSIVGILAIIMLVIGGMTYLTAAGDENRIETGKKIVTYSIIGILVALASLVLVTQIASFFA